MVAGLLMMRCRLLLYNTRERNAAALREELAVDMGCVGRLEGKLWMPASARMKNFPFGRATPPMSEAVYCIRMRRRTIDAAESLPCSKAPRWNSLGRSSWTQDAQHGERGLRERSETLVQWGTVGSLVKNDVTYIFSEVEVVQHADLSNGSRRHHEGRTASS